MICVTIRKEKWDFKIANDESAAREEQLRQQQHFSQAAMHVHEIGDFAHFTPPSTGISSVESGHERGSTSFSNFFKRFSSTSTVPTKNLITSIAPLRLKSRWT
jgi:hypothetical protein